MSTRQKLRLSAGATPALSQLAWARVSAQTWPSKTKRAVIPITAGGSIDIVGRTQGGGIEIQLRIMRPH